MHQWDILQTIWMDWKLNDKRKNPTELIVWETHALSWIHIFLKSHLAKAVFFTQTFIQFLWSYSICSVEMGAW